MKRTKIGMGIQEGHSSHFDHTIQQNEHLNLQIPGTGTEVAPGVHSGWFHLCPNVLDSTFIPCGGPDGSGGAGREKFLLYCM